MKAMKKLLALVMALALCLSLGVCAMADSTDLTTTGGFTKVYVDATGNTLTTVPVGDVLTFTVTATSAPSAYLEDSTLNDALGLLKVNGTALSGTNGTATTNVTVSQQSQTISLTENNPTVAGNYYYTITETSTTAQGVTISSATIYILMKVSYDNDRNLTTTIYSTNRTSDSGSEMVTDKAYQIKNVYSLGTLEVKKTINGDMADTSDMFLVAVTFTSTKPVLSAISYTTSNITTDQTLTYNSQSITVDVEGSIAAYSTDSSSGWTYDSATGTYTATITVAVTNSTTVTFSNIPDGVTYSVQEYDYTSGTINDDNYGYKTASYSVTDTQATPTVGSDNKSGTIDGAGTDTVTITNEKQSTTETGVSLESLPYVLVLVAVLALGAVLIVRKRRVED
ncbi:MAG: hypothetical protein LUH42_01895 [Oscillospiraceae bacterium]|nr:hypothetical protein [Oscillospiraceae bacterium]